MVKAELSQVRSAEEESKISKYVNNLSLIYKSYMALPDGVM